MSSIPSSGDASAGPPAGASSSPNSAKLTNKAKRPKSRVKPWMVMLSVLALLMVGWFIYKRFFPSDAGVGPVIMGTVTVGTLIETVSATGSVTPRTGAEIHIGSQVTGRIKRLYADVGTIVKPGQLIAQLDLPDNQATLDQAKAALLASQSKVVQSKESRTLGQAQLGSGLALAQATLDGSVTLLEAARAAAEQQTIQTPADIRKATAGLGVSVAALQAARSGLLQVEQGYALQIFTAEEALKQAQAADAYNQIEFRREDSLVSRGFVARAVVDQARQAALVSHSQVRSESQALELVKQAVHANLHSAQDLVDESAQNVVSARATLRAARAETFLTASKVAAVRDAEAVVRQSKAGLALAIGNLTTDAVNLENIAQANDAKSQAQQQIIVDQTIVNRSQLRSPIAGMVITLSVQQGETVAAGLAAPVVIVVCNLDRLEVDAYVDESDIGKVRVGQPVKIVVDAFPDQTITGVVSKVNSGSTIQQGIVTYDVVMLVSNTNHQLRPDMTANVILQTGKLVNVLVVPTVAIQVGVKGSTVGVLVKRNGQTVLTQVPVTVGGTDGVNSQILSGLKKGQQIVVAGGTGGPKSSPGGTSSPLSGGSGGRGR